MIFFQPCELLTLIHSHRGATILDIALLLSLG